LSTRQRCSICTNARIAWINEQLRGVPNYSLVARDTGLTRQSLQRHAMNHPLDVTVPLGPPSRLPNVYDGQPVQKPKRKYVKKARKPASVQGAKDVFLGAFKVSGDLNASADAAAVTRLTVQKWLEHDEQFSLRYNQARAEIVENLEATAIERARTGGQFVRKVYRAGQLIEEVHEWRPSDAALIKLLTSLKPEVYGEKIAITQTSIVKAVDAEAWSAV
jgi:hypothetical protein